MKRTPTRSLSKAPARRVPPSARQRNKLDKRQRILTAAWHLFVSQGYDATTTKQIAHRAKIASGTLFLYASDKLDLLAMLFHDRLAHAVDEGFATLPTKAPLIDQLMHIFGSFFQMYGEEPELSRRFVRQLLLVEGPNADRVNLLTVSFVARLQGLLTVAEQQGRLQSQTPSVMLAQYLFGMYYMSLMSWVMGYATLETAVDPLLRQAFELLLHGAYFSKQTPQRP